MRIFDEFVKNSWPDNDKFLFKNDNYDLENVELKKVLEETWPYVPSKNAKEGFALSFWLRFDHWILPWSYSLKYNGSVKKSNTVANTF